MYSGGTSELFMIEKRRSSASLGLPDTRRNDSRYFRVWLVIVLVSLPSGSSGAILNSGYLQLSTAPRKFLD